MSILSAETISELLRLISGIAFIVLVVGLIRPSLVVHWGEKRTRGRVLLYYGVGFFVLGILFFAMKESVFQEQDLKRGTRLLKAARTAYNAQDYQTATESATEAIHRLARAKMFDEATDLADSAQAFLDTAKVALEKQNIERGTRLLKAARTAYNAQDYQTAIDLATEATHRLKRKKMLDEATGLADDAQAFLNAVHKVERHVHHVFGESVTRDEEEVPSIISIKISTGYTVNVAYREQRVTFWDRQRENNRSLFIENSRKFMERVFTDPACSKVQRLFLRPHYILVNKYGQGSESEIGTFVLDRKVATKIDWRNLSDNMFERLLRTEGQFSLHAAF